MKTIFCNEIIEGLESSWNLSFIQLIPARINRKTMKKIIKTEIDENSNVSFWNEAGGH